MAKLDALHEVQLGIEATNAWGTEVASTVMMMGVEELTITPVEEAEQVNEMRGTLQPGYRAHVRSKMGEASLTGLLEIDDFPYWLASLGGPKTGTTDAAGTFTYSWDAPTEDSDTEDAASFTLMKTDRTDTYSLLGAVVNELTVSGESGGPITLDIGFMGKSVTTDVSASLSTRVTTPAMGHMGQLWIDPGSDSMGTTEIANQAYTFEWNVNANRKMLTHLGNLNPSGYREGEWEGSLSLAIEASTDSLPYLNSIIAATNAAVEKNVRLKFTASTDAHVQLDFSGVLLEAPELYNDEDNVVTLEFELMGQANSGVSSFASAEVKTGVSALT